jgi:hypothetical protein
MACVINSGILKDCKHSFSGLKEVWLGNYDDVSAVSYDANGVVTGLTMVSGATIYEFQFAKETAQFLEELVKNGAASYINQTLNFQLSSIGQTSKKVLDDLSLSKMFAIVKRADNLYWLAGDVNNTAGLEATVLTLDSGTALGDSNGATVTLVGAATMYASTIDAALVETLK